MQPVHYVFYRACVNLIGIGFASLILPGISVSGFMPLFISGIILTFFPNIPETYFSPIDSPFPDSESGDRLYNNQLILVETNCQFPIGYRNNRFLVCFFSVLFFISFINMVFDIFSSNSRVKIYYRNNGDS